MLTLVKDARAQDIVGLYSNKTKRKSAVATIYFTHDVDAADKKNTAPAAGVLELHRDALKRSHRVSQADFESICLRIDSNDEPDSGEPLRSEFWSLKEVYDRSLMREMYLGDQQDVRFELNLPTDKEKWGGTFTLIGNSGAGKTYWCVDLLLRYLRNTKRHARRNIIWISPEWEIDKTLKKLKDQRYGYNVIGIDISPIELKKSGLDAASFYQEKIARVIENHGEKALIIMDDFPDGAKALVPYLRDAYNTMLRTARHRVTSVISLQHTYAGNRNTSQALQSNKYIVFFPRSQQNRLIMFCRDHLMMDVREAKELVMRFAKLDRWLVIQMHSPVCMFCSKYLLLL